MKTDWLKAPDENHWRAKIGPYNASVTQTSFGFAYTVSDGEWPSQASVSTGLAAPVSPTLRATIRWGNAVFLCSMQRARAMLVSLAYQLSPVMPLAWKSNATNRLPASFAAARMAWVSAVARSGSDAGLMAIATGAAGLLAAIRWVQAKGPDFSAPMISTPSGAFPPGLMSNVFRGFDVCLLVTAPLLLGASPVWSLVLAAIVALLLFNSSSFDPEAIRAQQAEQTRKLERQKAEAQAARQRKR